MSKTEQSKPDEARSWGIAFTIVIVIGGLVFACQSIDSGRSGKGWAEREAERRAEADALIATTTDEWRTSASIYDKRMIARIATESVVEKAMGAVPKSEIDARTDLVRQCVDRQAAGYPGSRAIDLAAICAAATIR